MPIKHLFSALKQAIFLKFINMKIPIYQIDSFTNRLFAGNPAAVCFLPHWPSDELLQNIAIENNLAETGFFVKNNEHYEIRWFMPHGEIDLCGHATLASAYVIFNYLDTLRTEVGFSSKSGMLFAQKEADGSITLDFPSRPPSRVDIPEQILKAFKGRPLSAHVSRDLIVVFSTEKEIRTEEPIIGNLTGLPYVCVAITAKGDVADFVSRVFDVEANPPEDPVTGSTHASLVPFWSNQLGKTELTAKQLSKRGGDIKCRLEGDRVFLSGFAVAYLTGEIEI
jgi:predicted PhzF superfamily epimerase YddE/YHI9